MIFICETGFYERIVPTPDGMKQAPIKASLGIL